MSKNLIENIFANEEDISRAEERLIESAKNICCFCHLEDKVKVKKTFVIINEFESSCSSVDNYLLMHSLCDNCYKNLKVDQLNNNFQTFFCYFCEEEHKYNKIKFSNKKKRKSCCTHM